MKHVTNHHKLNIREVIKMSKIRNNLLNWDWNLLQNSYWNCYEVINMLSLDNNVGQKMPAWPIARWQNMCPKRFG